MTLFREIKFRFWKENFDMEDVITLDRLPIGRRAAVTALSAPDAQRRRMMDLGFVPGSSVTAVQESPWGDPVAYSVCGAVIALRRADAYQIAVHTFL